MLKLLYFLAFLIKAIFYGRGGKDGNTLQISSHHTNSSYLYPFEVVLRKMFSNDPFTPPPRPPPSHFKHSPRPSRRLTITMTSHHDDSSFRRLTITTTHHYDDSPLRRLPISTTYHHDESPFRRLTITTNHHFDDLPSRRITISTTFHYEREVVPVSRHKREVVPVSRHEREVLPVSRHERETVTTSHYDDFALRRRPSISTTSHYDDLPFRRPSITTTFHFDDLPLRRPSISTTFHYDETFLTRSPLHKYSLWSNSHLGMCKAVSGIPSQLSTSHVPAMRMPIAFWEPKKNKQRHDSRCFFFLDRDDAYVVCWNFSTTVYVMQIVKFLKFQVGSISAKRIIL